MQETPNGTINSPEYYKAKHGVNMEASDFIDAFELNFNLGNVAKYIARAGKKEGETRFQALWKAHNYLIREIINTGKLTETCRCQRLNHLTDLN